MLLATIGLALAIGGQSPAEPRSAAEAAPALPVSLSRIRAALEVRTPLRVTLPAPTPTFRVEIREQLLYSPHLLGPVEQLWSTTPGPIPPSGLQSFEQRQRLGPWSTPLFSMDLLSIGGALQRAFANARRARAENAARDEVQRELAEFCATHECQR